MTDSPMVLLGLGLAAGLLPFFMVMLTSFVKMAVVLGIVRSALGTPQIPPNSVVTGLALVLSLVVMAPVLEQVGLKLEENAQVFESGSAKEMLAAVGKSAEPVQAFLIRHTRPEHLAELKEWMDGDVRNDSWRVLVPAFVVGQLHDAFRMGFAIFLPFLLLDMLVAGVLLSLGMHMLSPTTVSLPFKLLLFAMLDGWSLIGTQLLGQYL
ncbi:MAG: EscR/YscR/HrcR family type III secretion system export apparatus protein [Deltaproteobacteria bacterium]|nr:EscR/YscR/HrcR family type III secretion system export apparatus protein [Deltaproteobacteria bacterium]